MSAAEVGPDGTCGHASPPGHWHCNVCHEDRPADAMVVEHFRDDHPDLWEKFQTWPDGSPVVVDGTLVPEDFG